MRLLLQRLIPLLLLAMFALLSGLALRGDSPTSDEAVHLAAGYAQLKTGDLRMNPEHPPLAKLWSALPLLMLDPVLPTDDPSWRLKREWTFGARFLHRNQIDAETLLELGRMPQLLLGLALLLLIWRWAGALYGPAGGLLAMTLAAFDPNLLAHSHYVTNDLALGLAFTATLYAVWRYRQRGQTGWLVAVGLLTGTMLGTKYSGAVALPLLPLWLWPSGPASLQKPLSDPQGYEAGEAQDPTQPARLPLFARFRQLAGRLLIVALLSYLVLAVAYMGEPIGPWWKGYRGMQSGWNSFLWGQVSEKGWYSYFLAAIFLKTPPATLFLLAMALLSLRRLPLRAGEGLLLIGSSWFLLVSSALRINIGIRHILPVGILLTIFAGRTLLPDLRRGPRRRLVALLALCTVLETVSIHPFYISYFSSLVGGPRQGYRYLSDSNLDWGQDLKRLAQWAHGQQLDGLLLGIFSSTSPLAYGLHFEALPGFGAATFAERPLEPLPARLIVAMSALNLQGVYFTAASPFHTQQPLNPTLYQFLLDRPPMTRLTPSIWIWDLTRDPDAVYRLGMIDLNFGWNRSAVALLERYVALRPEDTRTATGLALLKQKLAAEGALPAISGGSDALAP